MKKYLSIFILLIFACKNDNRVIIDTQKESSKSKYYKETVIQQGEDFLGLKLGEEYETASKVLPKENLVEENENYLYYKVEKTYSVAEYQLYFEENKLQEIDFDAIVYDETGTFDENGAKELFNDLKEDIINAFGKKYMTSSDETNEILFWNKDDKNVQLILEKAKVHAYFDIALK